MARNQRLDPALVDANPRGSAVVEVMARLPGWIVAAPKSEWTLSEDGREIIVPIRVRRWHPGLWLAVIRRLRLVRR